MTRRRLNSAPGAEVAEKPRQRLSGAFIARQLALTVLAALVTALVIFFAVMRS